MEKIEKYFLSEISENLNRPCLHRVSKYLQVKQWVHLYGNLLSSCSEDQLCFIKKVIWHCDCWDFVGGLKGVKLNRHEVGVKLLTQIVPDVGYNRLNVLQKYLVACCCCFENKIQELVTLFRQAILDSFNSYATYGAVVGYWTIKNCDRTVNQDLSDGFKSAIRDNNVEALEFFWDKLRFSLPVEEQKVYLIYAATRYHLRFNKANNELVSFVVDRLTEEFDVLYLLRKDLEENQYYSTFHHLVRNFEFDRALRLYSFICRIRLSYFDYALLIYSVLYPMLFLPFFPIDPNYSEFYHAGYEMLDALNLPFNVRADIFNCVEWYRKFTPPDRLFDAVCDLQQIIISDLHNANPFDQECRSSYCIPNNFYPTAVKDMLEESETDGVSLDKIVIEKAINHCYKYGDDSSDEEDTVMSYSENRALRELNKFNAEHAHWKTLGSVGSNSINVNELDKINEYNNLGFLVHAVSIKLLYSSQIQTVYYKKKPRSKKCRRLPNYNEICTAIDDAAHRIVKVSTDPPRNFSTLKVVIHAICRKINTNPVSFLNAIINKSLDNFFKTLMYDSEYTSRRWIGWDESRLGTLYYTFTQLSGPELNPDVNFDVSQPGSNFAVNFFLNLRLYNRLEKRKVKGNYWPDSERSTWKYSESARVKINNKVNKGGKRTDEVQFQGFGTAPYHTIWHNNLLSMRELYELPDTFYKGTNGISSHVASLHYLLFGTEVSRNPSALIHNMMVFDLMKNGKFVGKKNIFNEIPMSIKNAVMASRIKNSKYNENYMPCKYLYDHKTYKELISNNSWTEGHYTAAFDLLKKEKDLTIRWLEMKLRGCNVREWLDEKLDLKMEYVRSFFNLLQESCQVWYNIRLIS